MSKSSRTRKAKARARRHAAAAKGLSRDRLNDGASDLSLNDLNKTDKRYLIGFAILSAAITAVYWWLGGRSLFVFPAIMCIAVGARKYWTGPMRRFAEEPATASDGK